MNRLKRLAVAGTPIVRDVVGLAGLALVIAGVAEMSRAIAMIVAGGLIVGIVILWARKG